MSILPLLVLLASCTSSEPAGPVIAASLAAPTVDEAPAASPSSDGAPAVPDRSAPPGAPPPGAWPYPDSIKTELAEAWARRPEGYAPRTRHLRSDGGPQYTNRLFLQTSPYLLQHAHNPVNWFPWGDEAFELARALDRPVFLSVGYSTCHWCHVMEEESFEDPEIAAYMNANYVCIKVDREERPDIDAVYMAAVQAMSGGSGGWPMSVWLTPDRTPYYGGTYFPARDGDRGAGMGFLTLLNRLKSAYVEQHDSVIQNAQLLAAEVQKRLTPPPGAGIAGIEVLQAAAKAAHASFDPVHGGRRGGQKFPSSYPLRSMLRHHRRSGDEGALAEVTQTLDAMARGGIHDQVGGGFHRYATDPAWLVPHFEQMLYDNALLVPAYVEAWQATGDPEFKRVARQVLRYVGRDMTAPGGGFYSATDADSLAPDGEREEGWFFTWTPAELQEALGPEAAARMSTVWGVTAGGNFEGRNILNLPRPLGEVAVDLGTSEDALRAEVDAAKELLYEARKERPAPLRDDKILAGWNGLMISAFARAALAFGDPDDAARAAAAADFVLKELRPDGTLRRAWLAAPSRYPAYFEDHAFLVQGLLDLYEATGAVRWLKEALALDGEIQRRFEDPAGGWFVTPSDGETLLVRQKPSYDGAVPTGTSVHVLSLYRLLALTGDDRYRVRAEAALKASGAVLEQQPLALSELLLAVDFRTDRALEVVVVEPEGADPADVEALMAPLRRSFLPSRVLMRVREGAQERRLGEVTPLADGKNAVDGRPTAYVCEQGACKWPTSDPKVFAEQLGVMNRY